MNKLAPWTSTTFPFVVGTTTIPSLKGAKGSLTAWKVIIGASPASSHDVSASAPPALTTA